MNFYHESVWPISFGNRPLNEKNSNDQGFSNEKSRKMGEHNSIARPMRVHGIHTGSGTSRA